MQFVRKLQNIFVQQHLTGKEICDAEILDEKLFNYYMEFAKIDRIKYGSVINSFWNLILKQQHIYQKSQRDRDDKILKWYYISYVVIPWKYIKFENCVCEFINKSYNAFIQFILHFYDNNNDIDNVHFEKNTNNINDNAFDYFETQIPPSLISNDNGDNTNNNNNNNVYKNEESKCDNNVNNNKNANNFLIFQIAKPVNPIDANQNAGNNYNHNRNKPRYNINQLKLYHELRKYSNNINNKDTQIHYYRRPVFSEPLPKYVVENKLFSDDSVLSDAFEITQFQHENG